jgi:hypothetical protein
MSQGRRGRRSSRLNWDTVDSISLVGFFFGSVCGRTDGHFVIFRPEILSQKSYYSFIRRSIDIKWTYLYILHVEVPFPRFSIVCGTVIRHPVMHIQWLHVWPTTFFVNVTNIHDEEKGPFYSISVCSL